MGAQTHIVGMESLVLVRAGGAARAWRGRGAAARPPAREYHRRARMPARACGTQARAAGRLWAVALHSTLPRPPRPP